MYDDRLIHHGSQCDSIDAVAFARNIHANQAWEKIQDKIPGLCIAKKGREVTLTYKFLSSEEHD